MQRNMFSDPCAMGGAGLVIPNNIPAEKLPYATIPAAAVDINETTFSTSTGKFPAPLTENKLTPGRAEQNRIAFLKHRQPK